MTISVMITSHIPADENLEAINERGISACIVTVSVSASGKSVSDEETVAKPLNPGKTLSYHIDQETLSFYQVPSTNESYVGFCVGRTHWVV